jgi:hypothetical protein
MQFHQPTRARISHLYLVFARHCERACCGYCEVLFCTRTRHFSYYEQQLNRTLIHRHQTLQIPSPIMKTGARKRTGTPVNKASSARDTVRQSGASSITSRPSHPPTHLAHPPTHLAHPPTHLASSAISAVCVSPRIPGLLLLLEPKWRELKWRKPVTSSATLPLIGADSATKSNSASKLSSSSEATVSSESVDSGEQVAPLILECGAA